MSYTRSVDLICDECGDSDTFALSGTVGEARKVARSFGWRFRKGKDFCSKCGEVARRLAAGGGA